MSKTKIWIASLIAFVLLVSVAGAAYASAGDAAPSLHPGGPGRGNRAHGQGEVLAVGDNEFTLLTRNENEITVQVDADTRYFGDLKSFSDIEVGMTVAVMGLRQGDETAVAIAVGSGDEFPLGQRAGGEVTAVSANSVTIEKRDGDSLTFAVDSDTVFLSRDEDVDGISDIEVGDRIGVHYEETSDGSLIAKTIMVGGPEGRPNGANIPNDAGLPNGNQNGNGQQNG